MAYSIDFNNPQSFLTNLLNGAEGQGDKKLALPDNIGSFCFVYAASFSIKQIDNVYNSPGNLYVAPTPIVTGPVTNISTAIQSVSNQQGCVQIPMTWLSTFHTKFLPIPYRQGSYYLNDSLNSDDNPKLTKFLLVGNGLTAAKATQAWDSTIPKEYCFEHDGQIKDYRVEFGLRPDSNRLLSTEAFNLLLEEYLYKSSFPSPPLPPTTTFVEENFLPGSTVSWTNQKPKSANSISSSGPSSKNSNNKGDKNDLKLKPKFVTSETVSSITMVKSNLVLEYTAFLVVPHPSSSNQNPMAKPIISPIKNDQLMKYITKYYYSSINAAGNIVFSKPTPLEGSNQPKLQSMD